MDDQKKNNETNKEIPPDWRETAENLLTSIQSGWRVSVWRTAPSWCQGYLETIAVEPSRPVDFDYLAQEWGGETLSLKLRDESGKFRGGADIDLRSYPPKFRAVPMTRNDVDIQYHTGNVPGPKGHRKNRRDLDDDRQYQIVNQQSPSNADSLASTFKDLVEVLGKFRKNDLDMMALNNKNTVPDNPMDQMLHFARVQKEMSELMGWGERQMSEPQSDNSALFSTLGEVVKSLTQQKPPPAMPQFRPPTPHISAQPAHIQNDVRPAPSLPANPIEMLAKLEPEQAADMFSQVVNLMGEEKADKMFNILSSRQGIDSEIESDNEDEYTDESEIDPTANA